MSSQDDSRRALRLMELSVVACALVVFASMLATLFYTRHLDASRRAEQIAGCERANQQRRYINKIIEHHPDFDLPPIAIPVCSQIIK